MLASIACAGTATAPRLDCLHERITVVSRAPDGSAMVHFELSQRVFRIDPVASPNPAAMLAFAEAAKESGQRVHATIAASKRVKGDDGPPFVLIRLADTPDPAR